MGVDPDEKRRRWAAEKGIATVLPAVPVHDTVWCRPTELVAECSGHEAAVCDACRMLLGRRYSMRSGWEWEVPEQPTDFRVGNGHEIFKAEMRWIAEGRIDVRGLYDPVSPKDAKRYT